MDPLGYPFMPLYRSFIILWREETGRGDGVAGELLVGSLSARTTMQVNNHIQPSVSSPANDAIEVCKAAAREELVVVDKTFQYPEPDGYTDCVEAERSNFKDILLCYPCVPMCSEGRVGGGLAEGLDARPFVVLGAAAHRGEFVVGHPWFDDEEGAVVDAADFPGGGWGG